MTRITDELFAAAQQVESWWLTEGARHFDGAPACIFALRHAVSRAAAPAPEPDAMTKAVKQLADWLLTEPNDGMPLCFAGAPEPTVLGLSRVKMRSVTGDEWTLTAGLREGWLTAEERATNFWRIAKLEREEVAREEAARAESLTDAQILKIAERHHALHPGVDEWRGFRDSADVIAFARALLAVHHDRA